MGKQSKKVVAIADREKKKQQKECKLYAEALCRSNPSDEAKAFINAKLDATLIY